MRGARAVGGLACGILSLGYCLAACGGGEDSPGSSGSGGGGAGAGGGGSGGTTQSGGGTTSSGGSGGSAGSSTGGSGNTSSGGSGGSAGFNDGGVWDGAVDDVVDKDGPCGPFSGGESACDQCSTAKCCSALSACAAATGCSTIMSCLQGGESVDACKAKVSGGSTEFDALQACVTTNCATECL